ncbi:MAG: hypothetical protein WDM81_11970 [Rhizomicrobium sp.]
MGDRLLVRAAARDRRAHAGVGARTAWWAHVGGFAAGLVLTPLLKSRDVAYFGPFDVRGPWGR